MNFSKTIQRKNKLLLPFSWLYIAGVAVYHKLYDWGWKPSVKPGMPLICVGNLSVGGTGKTPMVEYLLRLLSKNFNAATISRGYKRSTRGVYIADENTTAHEIGDEPMQFHTKFPQVKVAVGERRVEALAVLLQKHPETQVVILDDAFQHRAIEAGLNILLTDYNNLFTDDYYVPAGQLRDLKSNYKRADIIIITKCPQQLSEAEAKNIIEKIQPLSRQSVFFTCISYGTPFDIFSHQLKDIRSVKHAVFVTGIAHPQPLADYLKRHDIGLNWLSFADHHRFNQAEVYTIKQTFLNIRKEYKVIITTEKDAMRLREFEEILKELPVFAIPVEHYFLFGAAWQFESIIHHFIQTKKSNYGKKEQAGEEKNSGLS